MKTFLFLLTSLYSSLLIGNNLSLQMSRYNDKIISTLYASTHINDTLSVNAELDSTGYLAIGAGYGMMLGQFYVEGYGSYGRADNLDIYDLGVFTTTQITPALAVYFDSSHQWRETKGFPILDLAIFDQKEWKNTLGASYQFTPWMRASYALSYDKLLSGNEDWKAVENDHITYQDISLTFITPWVEPFITYTAGTHRVRPGEPVTKSDSIELGIHLSF